MAMDRLSLCRCLEAMQMPLVRRQKLIERDARRAAIKEKLKLSCTGQDFYGAFWSDAKKSAVNDDFDLRVATIERVARNRSRRNLYPRLLAGFEAGWTRLEELATFVGNLEPVGGIVARLKGRDENDVVDIGNLLAVKDRADRLHLVAPYFSKTTPLGQRHARIGIGTMSKEFARLTPSTVAILDVVRGQLFANDEVALDGSEEDVLLDRYDAMMREWRVQKRYYLRS